LVIPRAARYADASSTLSWYVCAAAASDSFKDSESILPFTSLDVLDQSDNVALELA